MRCHKALQLALLPVSPVLPICLSLGVAEGLLVTCAAGRHADPAPGVSTLNIFLRFKDELHGLVRDRPHPHQPLASLFMSESFVC